MVRYRIAIIVWLLFTPTAWAVPPLYQLIAERESIPPTVLYSLALTESQLLLSNGTVRPWPWTLNVDKKPYRYSSKTEACQALMQFLKYTSSVDIGLVQISWRWHSAPFSSPCDVLEPEINLTYAAQLMEKAYAKLGDWTKAAGFYHRPAGGAPAERYRQAFAKNYARTLNTFPGGSS